MAEVVILCIGLDESSESEGLDRTHIGIPAVQKQLLDAVTSANPNVVAVVSAGSVIETDWTAQCRAVVHGYLGGQAGAAAMLDVLTGWQNPCGKLAETIPLRYEDTPAARYFPGKGQNAEYREGLYVGYRYYETVDKAVRYPFGYGLSYTTFAYSDLKINADHVTFTLTNTGKRDGAEVAQLYVAKPDAMVFRPAKELKGFAKVFLKAGESKTVTIPLDDKAFRYWNVLTDRWEVEGGSYRILVGSSVQDIRLSAELALPGTGAPDPYAGKALPDYYTGNVQNIPDAEFEALLGRSVPKEKTAIDRTMTLGELHHSRSPLCWLIAGVLTLLLRAGEKRGKPDLNILFQYNMPLRGLAQMTNGMIGGRVCGRPCAGGKGLLGHRYFACAGGPFAELCGQQPLSGKAGRAVQIRGGSRYEFLERFCGKAPCRCQVGAGGRTVCYRVQPHHRVQIPAAAIPAQGLCQLAGGGLWLAGY